MAELPRHGKVTIDAFAMAFLAIRGRL